MQIVEISEPGSASKDNREDEVIVGIDFGTTHSLICLSRNHSPHIFKDSQGRELIPSIITFNNKGTIIGNEASEVSTITSIKRLLGKNKEEIINSPLRNYLDINLVEQSGTTLKFKYNESIISLPEAAAEIFKYLKISVEEALSRPITKAVITVPAYFDDAAKGEVMLAAKIAGFTPLRLLAEPTAAAYAYGLNKNSEGCYLVYDLGGGTFDVSILNMHKEILQVIAVGGDNLLGGDDIDELLAVHLSSKYKISHSLKLLKLAKNIKEQLSVKDYVTITEENIIITKAEFETIIQPLINRTMRIVKDTLENADNPQIDGIILVGGSTRTPLIRRELESKYNAKIFCDIDPDKAVVYGAAFLAENLCIPSNDQSLLLDVVPLSLGLELYGGVVEKIILRNSPIPLSIIKEYTTYADNQTALQIHVLQGERELVEDCRSLAHFELKGLPPAKAGTIRVEITFTIDGDGILSVSALEKTTGISSIIEVKPAYSLSQQEIDTILENAFALATDDHIKRLVLETRSKAKMLIYNLETAIKEMPEILDRESLSHLQYSIDNLKEVIGSEDRNIIENMLKKLELDAASFNELRLQKIINDLMSGKNINNIVE